MASSSQGRSADVTLVFSYGGPTTDGVRLLTREILDARRSPSSTATTPSSLLERVCEIVKLHPESIIPRTTGLQHTPLHIICMASEVSEQLPVVQFFTTCIPEAVRRPDRFGLLPLHYACKSASPVEVVEHLISMYPESVQVKDHRGRLPLYHAMDSMKQQQEPAHQLELIRFLVERYPESLHNHQQDHQEHQQLMDDGYSALHIACKYNPSLELVQYLVQQHGESLYSTDAFQRLPLHLACIANAPLDVIVYLVQQHAASIRIQDAHGKLPLYYACLAENKSVVLYLLQEMYGISRTIEQGAIPNDGQLPILHAICADPTTSLTEVQYCVEHLFPDESIQLQDEQCGALPLHWACSRRCQPSASTSANDQHDHHAISVIEYLIDKYPKSCHVPDHTGALPLHWACRDNQSHGGNTIPSVIQSLVLHFPGAIEHITQQEYGRTLPVHLAIRNSSSISLDTLYFLIREYPQAVLS